MMKEITSEEKYVFYEDVFDNMPDAVYVLDDLGNMLYVNYAMIKKFDLPRDVLLKYNVNDMYNDGLIDYVISNNVYEQKKEVVMCQKIFNSRGKEQMQMAYLYDYVVMNDDLDAAVEDVVHIISTVRRRTMLHKKLIDRINATFVEE